MFHMLTCFNLRPGVEVDEFKTVYAAYIDEMKALGLVEGSGPVGRRRADSGLDTDAARDHGWFALMSFRDKAQSDAALRHIKTVRPGGDPAHQAVIDRAADLVFVAWEDV